MSLVGNITKIYAAKRLLLFLTKDIDKLQAFKLGVIDASGKQIVKTRDMTQQQKDSFGPFEKICIWVRRVLKNHGVAQMAVALTYLEDKQYDEFMIHLKKCVEDSDVQFDENAFDPTMAYKPDVSTSILQDVLDSEYSRFQYQDIDYRPHLPPQPQKDDFWSNVMLIEALEDVLCKEDMPTTSTAGIATYAVPLKDKDVPEAKKGFEV
ncbi:hypothetical protein Ab1vBOLIVR5_gp168c [Agrobacterium phage OLIVR5]|uniref:Uncharacterized protein n=2 Tax=Caudoviricetes TaxID=2731619 RepID=A0A858MSX1_9CAUD|nr:hypothetical protein KNU99_gp233 [Agrobacterium phage OLIVR5]QIW87816.1 hypothetical protein Ab1vBOLIVR5_gp168c [Agrobacterium phage OLIVR5]QIW88081.1 hypothetical protein Ab1vBOLIVR6_gp174c [Agrobacterium phage OLIVR6]